MRFSLLFSWLLAPTAVFAAGQTASPRPIPNDARVFLEANCLDCHSADYAEGGFRVDELLASEADLDRWVRIWDRVHEGEMPPEEPLKQDDRDRFLHASGDFITQSQRQEASLRGRVQERRLTNRQLERTLHDLLGIDIPLASLLPKERRTDGYTTVAAGQSLSHFDLQNHLTIVDAALDEMFRRATDSENGEAWVKEFDAPGLVDRKPNRPNREPEMFGGKAVVWNHPLVFYGRISPTRAWVPGWYRFTAEVSSVKDDGLGVWTTLRTGAAVSSNPAMREVATFQAVPEPKTVVAEAWLDRDDMFEIKPHDSRLKTGKTKNGQVAIGELVAQDVPGVAMHWATLEKFHKGPDRDGIRRMVFPGWKFAWQKKKKISEPVRLRESALEETVSRFAERAFRRPVDADTLAPYLDAARAMQSDGMSNRRVLQETFRAILCSPRFLYLAESPGELDDHALASRLSYFLTGSMPDEQLRELADRGKLGDPQVLAAQTDRLLDGERTRRFAVDFAHQWLDLSEVDFTEPDRRLKTSFDLVVQTSLLAETRTTLTRMFEQDRSVTGLVDSGEVLLNERLASFYGFSPEGLSEDRSRVWKRDDHFVPDGPVVSHDAELRAVAIPDDHPRGGLLTQGAVLKVTANGTSTSPVLRGVWVCERLLGMHVPPPPDNVPAVEPDIRGAKTIREQLDKHRSDPSCASCHRKIDPAGFALEVFNPVGQYRPFYQKRKRGQWVDAIKVDAADTLPAALGIEDGAFADVVEMQQKLAAHPEPLARNVAMQLVTYGTGGRPGFADRPELDRIVQRSAASGYGMRTILHEVVQSELFRRK